MSNEGSSESLTPCKPQRKQSGPSLEIAHVKGHNGPLPDEDGPTYAVLSKF
jgi:hypothetical protein